MAMTFLGVASTASHVRRPVGDGGHESAQPEHAEHVRNTCSAFIKSPQAQTRSTRVTAPSGMSRQYAQRYGMTIRGRRGRRGTARRSTTSRRASCTRRGTRRPRPSSPRRRAAPRRTRAPRPPCSSGPTDTRPYSSIDSAEIVRRHERHDEHLHHRVQTLLHGSRLGRCRTRRRRCHTRLRWRTRRARDRTAWRRRWPAPRRSRASENASRTTSASTSGSGREGDQHDERRRPDTVRPSAA